MMALARDGGGDMAGSIGGKRVFVTKLKYATTADGSKLRARLLFRELTAAAALLAARAVGGCDLPDAPGKNHCFTGRDCRDGFMCVAQRCVLPDDGGGGGGDLAMTTPGDMSTPGGDMACDGTLVGDECRAGRWTRGADMPTPRERLALVAVPDGRIFALGGISEGAGEQRKVEVYTPATDSWTTVAPMMVARYGFAATLGPDGRIYAIGGPYRNASDDGISRSVEAYDLVADQWSYDPPVLGSSRYEARAFTGSDGRIYVVGGFDYSLSEQLATAESWQPGETAWTPLGSSMNTGRSAHGLTVAADGRVFVFGGSAGSIGSTASVEFFRPGQVGWTTAAPLALARDWLAAATAPDGRLYAIGGNGEGPGSEQAFGEVEIYAPADDKWTAGPPLPTPRYGLGAVTGADGNIYVIGGNGEGSVKQ